MHRCLSRGALLAAALLILSAVSCAKPASPDRRRTGPRTAPPAADQSYTIVFERPVRVGLKYKMVATGMTDNKTTVNGRIIPAQTVKLTWAYEGVHTVKAVHADGRATKKELKIVKLQLTKGADTRDLLAADTVVLAVSEGGKEKFSVNGKPVDPNTAKLLRETVTLRGEDSTTTDDLFGPDGPKKPGDTWRVNVARMLAGMKRKFKAPALWPKPSDVTGKVTFVAVKKLKGMDALEIKAETKMENIAPNLGPVRATAGTLELAISGLLPKDTRLAASGTMNMSMKMHVEGEVRKGAQLLQLVVDVHQSQQGHKELIK